MNLPVILSPPAGREFKDAANFYEQRQVGLGEDFVDRVQETLDRIGRMPAAAAPVFLTVRRMRLVRFPYSVFYRILDGRIEVLANHHSKRDPKIWQGRA